MTTSITCALTGLVAAGSGCILTPNLDVEGGDAGPSSPPVIASSAPPFEFPGPFVLERDNTDATLSLTIRDNDIDDTVFVRVFLDYDPETGAGLVSDCGAAPESGIQRSVDCPLALACSLVDEGDTGTHVLEAVVTDRDWLMSDDPDAATQPPLRAVANNAGLSIRGWVMSCN